MINYCKSKVCCRVDSCNKRNHTLWLPPSDNSSDGSPSYQDYHHATDSHNTEISEPSNETEAAVKSHRFLQVIPIILLNGPLSVEANAFLKCESDTTLLRKNIAKKSNQR